MNHLRTEPLTPNQIQRQLRRVEWSMVSKAAEKSNNTKAVGSPLDKISELHFLWREELSLLSDRLYMLTGTGCLSYGHGYVLSAV